MVKENWRFDEEYDVAVIGAGIGGLTCAAYLAKNGRKVKVLEQHVIPGGCCTSFSRKGFKFDAGVLHLTGGKESGAFQKVMSALNMEGELEFKEQFQRFVFPDFTYDSTRNYNDYPQKLKELFPEEAGGIEKLFNTIKSIYEDIKKLPAISPLLKKYERKSYQDLIEEHIKSTKLKALVNANWHLWNPAWKNSAIDFASLVISEAVHGYFYPVGGIQAVPDALVRVLKRNGGEIEYRTLADKIILVNGEAIGIETVKGKRIKAQQIVSNIAARATFFNLIGERNLPAVFADILNTLEISLSAFYVYLGIDIDPRETGLDAPETIVYESYDNKDKWELLLQGDIAVPCFGIAVPTYMDPGLAPSGKHVVIIMTMAPYSLKGKSWREEKKRMTNILIAKAEKLIPGLSRHIVVQDSATPLTYERYTLNSLGAAMGWAFTPQMFMRRPEQKTPVPNLYLAGQWTMPGGGVAAVAMSGLRAARMILREAY